MITGITIYAAGLGLTAAVAFFPNGSSGWPTRGTRPILALICLGWPVTVPLAAIAPLLDADDEVECPEWASDRCGAM